MDCNLSICDRCKDIVHQTFGEHHKVIHLKDIGGKCSSGPSQERESDNKSKSKAWEKVTRTWQFQRQT